MFKFLKDQFLKLHRNEFGVAGFLLPLALGGISLLSKRSAAKKQEKFQKDIEKFQALQQRRQAIQRALGVNQPFTRQGPQAPSLRTEGIVSGLADIGAQTATGFLARPGSFTDLFRRRKPQPIPGVSTIQTGVQPFA